MRFRHIVFVAALLACSCGGRHFLTDEVYRRQVEQDYAGRMASIGMEPLKGQKLTTEEQEALAFLYAYMPLADAVDYEPSFYLENVRASFRTREEMGWNIPEREFRHFVLPLRVNNENLDSARVVFYRELKPRVEGLSLQEAILEVNHWCHEKASYQPSDARTLSPLSLVRNALGRCGEESTFCVAALRSVGIPARQVYTPRWAHTDDNHAWVEAWADGQWHFLGACEPEPVLDLGWFNSPASRALLMHTKVFGRYDGPEEVVLQSPNYTEVNLIDNYAATARMDFQVVWSKDAPNKDAGKPVEGARVDFCIYNYAEFYPAVSKYTDAEGRTFTSAGLGDMLVWASKGHSFGFAKVSFGAQQEATIVLQYYDGDKYASPVGVKEAFTVVPPPENVQLPEVTPQQRAANDARFAQEDALRHAYEATFPTQEQALAFVREQGYADDLAACIVRSRGNAEVIKAFMAGSPDHGKVEAIFASLSTKDFQDISLPLLQAYYKAEPFLGARIENEFLSDYYAFFQSESGAEASQKGIQVLKDPTLWRIPISPAGVWRCKMADPRSLDLFTVALLRARGTDARKNPVTGVLESREEGGDWKSLGAAPGTADPKGVLKLTYKPSASVKNPQYYTHFSLSKLVDGRPQLLTFDEGEVDMGGGVDWAHVFKKGCPLDEGTYLLVSGNRLADGSVPVSLRFVAVEAGKATVEELRIDDGAGSVPVIGSFDAELCLLPEGASAAVSVLSQVGRGCYALALLDPGKEPTNHALRDLAAAAGDLEAWGRPVVLLCASSDALARLQKELAEGRYGQLPGTVQMGVATPELAAALAVAAGGKALPQVIIADSFNRVFFRSAGYTIGLGARIADVAARL
ncbi:MAG: transglutaminase domain-containing protein [Bacteroidales bacterium]|nr:transglutaminase domain-containing protein [Bacteroidales bacterium]